MQEGCRGHSILQSLPQAPVDFATSAYDASTTCEEVKTPQHRPRSYERDRSLRFLSILTPAVQALPYTVCSETSWTTFADLKHVRVGPLQTFLFFDNTCANGSATLRVSISNSAGASP